MGEFLFIDMADVTLIDDKIPLVQEIAEGYDGNKNLLDHFVTTKYGLKAFQPTLFWTLKFIDTDYSGIRDTKYSDQIHFVDSVIIPGESLETDSIDTALFDIRYPLVNRRSTKNQFTVGMYEDIYSSTEQIISEEIKKRSLNGGKHTESTVDILVIGYLMRGGTKDKWDRYPRIGYFFDDCYPISIDDYKYDHTNQKWANVRNVTFAFRDYHFKTYSPVPKIDVETFSTSNIPTKSYTHSWDDNNEPVIFGSVNISATNINNSVGIGKTSDGKKVAIFKNVVPNADDRTYRNWTNEVINTWVNILPDKSKDYYSRLPDKADDPYSRMPGDHKIGLMDYNAGKSEEISKFGPTDQNIPINDKPYTNPYITEPKLREDLAHDKLDTQGAIEQYTSDFSINNATSADKPAILKDWKFDTPLPSLNRDSLITSIIKTAVRKFLIPDTPLYNSGHGMAWQPDFMKDVSKAIRKVQQVFYTEPKIKHSPEDDHTAEMSHYGANKVSVDPDDTPSLDPFSKKGSVEIPYDDHIINHGPANTVRIDEDDFTRITQHGDPNSVNIDPNDHTTLEAHGKPNNVNIDPNDHTMLESHNEGNLAMIDPNDYTTLEAHGQPNNVPIDPNDHTTHTEHDTGNLVNIDPNDFVDSRSDVKPMEIPVDPNDRLEQTKAVGKQVAIDLNDFADSEKLKANEVPIDKNDTPDARNVRSNTKEIDEKDYVLSDTIKAKEITMPTNDVPDTSDMKTKTVNIDPKDYVNADHKESRKNIVAIQGNDRTTETTHTDIDAVYVPKDDTITKFDVIDNLVPIESDNDRIVKHQGKPDLVDLPGNDTPDVEHISDRIDRYRPETSLMDFANMIVKELKNDRQDRIMQHESEGNIKNTVSDPLVKHDQNAINILDRSKENDTINTLNRDTGRVVDVHKDDHTEMI